MEWKTIPFEQSIQKITYTAKIPKKMFLKGGAFPVVSQEADFINGYWNNEDDVFKVSSPVVIFGDHTKVIKHIDFDFVLGADGVKILSPIKGLNSKFLAYFLESCDIGDLGYARHYRLLKSFSVPLPPIQEQKRIVALLDTVFADLEQTRAKTEQNLKNARELFDSYLQQVFSQKGEGWVETTLGKLCEKMEYGTSSKSQDDGDIPVLRMGNIQNGELDWGKLKYTNNQSDIDKLLLKEGDVLFNRTNSPELVGKSAIYRGEMPAIFAGYLIRIHRKKDLLDANFLNYYLNSNLARTYGFSVMSHSTNQANINGTKLKSYPINIPNISVQLLLSDHFRKIESEVKKLEKIYQKKLEGIDELKKSILQKAFNGELTNAVA